MSKPNVHLKPTEIAFVEAAAQLYAAYLISGRVKEGQEMEWMERALKDVLKFARAVEGVDAADSNGATRPQAAATRRNGSSPSSIELVPDLGESKNNRRQPAGKPDEPRPRKSSDEADYLPEIDRVLLDDEMSEPSVAWTAGAARSRR